MDQICIKDLEIFAHHGVFQEEKQLGQKFILTITLDVDLYTSAISGDLEQTVNYGVLCQEVEDVFTQTSYDLIETAGENVAEYILSHYPIVHAVSVQVKKPWAPIGKSLDTASITINRGRHRAFIAFGSNMGDSRAIIDNALKKIESLPGILSFRASSIIETAPWGYENQDNFLNGVIDVTTWIPPHALLKQMLKIEQEAHRERIIKWGPRTLDLDLIFYDDLILETPDLILPHPLMAQRAFVLEPMAELAPYFVHPVYHQNMTELLTKLNTQTQ